MTSRTELIKVAKLYYHGGCPQEEIALIMGYSRPRISRMLSLARELKLVEFNIPESPEEIGRMEIQLKEKLEVDEVCVVPSESGRLGAMYTAGVSAGEYFNNILKNGMSVGVSWGATMDVTVSQLKPKKQYPSITVLQMIGGSPSSSFNVDSRELTIRLANKLGASYSLLQTPQYVSSKAVKETLMNEPEIAAHFKKLKALDAALIGIGSTDPEQSAVYRAGYLSFEEVKALSEDGFATDICGNRIYIDGTIRQNDMNDKLIAISPEDIKRIPIVVAVAVGEDKAATIMAAAKGGFFNVLITDEVAAISILGRN